MKNVGELKKKDKTDESIATKIVVIPRFCQGGPIKKLEGIVIE